MAQLPLASQKILDSLRHGLQGSKVKDGLGARWNCLSTDMFPVFFSVFPRVFPILKEVNFSSSGSARLKGILTFFTLKDLKIMRMNRGFLSPIL